MDNILLETITEGLLKLRNDFDNLPNYENEINNINSTLKVIQYNQLTKDSLKEIVNTFLAGFLATSKDEYSNIINQLLEQLKQDNQTILKDEIDNLSNQIDNLIKSAINNIDDKFIKIDNNIKSKYENIDSKFMTIDSNIKSETIKLTDIIDNELIAFEKLFNNIAKSNKDSLDTLIRQVNSDIKNIKNSVKNGTDGVDGISIKDISLKDNNLVIELTNNDIKTIALPKIKQIVSSGGGGYSKKAIQDIVSEMIGSSGTVDAYTKAETDTLIANAIDGLVNGASNILDTFGEVESVLTTLTTQINANSQSIANLATAQGEFGSSTVQSITTTETNLDFDVLIPSTDTNVLNLDATNNQCYFGINASFNFRSDMTFNVDTPQPITVTIRGRNIVDNSLVYSRTVDIHQANGTTKSVSTNTLLTIGKNSFPNAPLMIYFTIQATDTGISIHEFNSILTSSSQYDLGTLSYTKAESDAKFETLANQNLFIQSSQPTLATGKTALWIDTSNDDIMFNIVVGD